MLPVSELTARLVYDETSPTCLRWRVGIPTGAHGHFKVKAGDVAGGLNTGDGYFQVGIGGRQFKGHVIVWLLERGGIPEGMQVDHKDGDKTNSRVSNLRLVTVKGNARNTRMSARNSSGMVGVTFSVSAGKPYWRAFWFKLDGRQGSAVFSINRHGLLPAYAMAVTRRRAEIDKLNRQGAGYTERHGT